MTYEQAIKEAKAGKRVRHSKMGRGFYVVWAGGDARILSPIGGVTPFKIDTIDRAQKDWEVVG